jgi:hypothetical protein
LAGGSVVATGNWDQVTCQYTETSSNNRAVLITARQTGDGTLFYIDGLQVEQGFRTTYIDGDQAGGTWLGGQHVSPSIRSGQYRGGGSVIALADLGLSVDQQLGAGMPPIENSSQSYAVIDGAQYQRTRASARHFTLTVKPIVGTSLADFHVTRRTLIDVFKPDLVTPQQPTRFIYVGGQGTVQADGYYEKGLELGNMDGVIAENAAISFAAYDPYWYAPTQQGTTLAAKVSLGSVNYMARRSPLGAWGTMGQTSGTTIQPTGAIPTAIRAFIQNPGGTVFFGGGFGTLAGTRGHHVGMYFPTTNLFGTLQGGTIPFTDGPVLAFAQNPSGTLFIGGAITSVAGTVAAALIRWTGAFGTLQGGTIVTGGNIRTLLYSPFGTLFFGGDFANVQGTANSKNIAMWAGAFGTLGGTANNAVLSLAWGLDNRLFLGGAFTNLGGTVGTTIGFWKSGTFGTMNSTNAPAFGVTALGVGPSGQLYEAGDFTIAGGGSALRSAVWNGVQHQPLGGGLGGDSWSLAVDRATGKITYGGAFLTAGSISAPANYAVWNGASWTLPDIAFTGGGFANGTIYAMLQTPDGALYVGGDFSGTTTAAAVGTIINTGRAQVYPTMRIRNLGAGTARLYQLLNVTTGDGIYFNYVMQGGESALLTLQPGARSFQSSAQGNVFGLILPGSNLSTWALLPGTNYVSHFNDGGTVETSFFWTPRSWSIDGGTVY